MQAKSNPDITPGSKSLQEGLVSDSGQGIQEHAAGGLSSLPDADLKNLGTYPRGSYLVFSTH